ncbi:NAD-dependent epimerase/dehydratase family protein [Streptomyces sp. NPDC057579]|uniref:NAD-dependent epimerase/dehydratase family protein n=1 Tax=Streptomyces sp. NPDC057579 TaxID=3346172 RepID=UPI0036895E4A
MTTPRNASPATGPLLVTGATGTTGSRLAARLTAAGHPVRAASRRGGRARRSLHRAVNHGI